MDCLPETEEETGRMGETAEATEKNKAAGGFRKGFAAGVFTTLLCAGVFVGGQLAVRRVQLRLAANGDGGSDQGAEVLTDSATLYKLKEIEAIIDQSYLKDVDSSLLSAYLFKGIAAGLDDDYASYYTAQELQTVLDSSKGEYYGVGAVLMADSETKELTAVQVYENSPAGKAGLATGDILRTLNDEPLTGMDLTEAVALIKGQEDTFTLGIYRPDTEEELTLTLACGEVEIRNVEYEMKENAIGYLRLSEFTDSAVSQFQTALESLKEQGMEKLIVDLRGNPGGLLTSVCDILDQILPEGLIVYTEDRDGSREEYRADDTRLIDCEVAVLVNGNSASASEIFAGAVQDYGLGPVIGTQTYGKGVVQKTYTLSDGSAFKLTVEKYYTPNGQDIDGNGITPDVVVEESTEDGDDTDAVLARALEILEEEA